jgi:hypothetical protein
VGPGFAQQRLSDMGDGILAQDPRFILNLQDQRQREEIIKRFGLSAPRPRIVRHRLTGPAATGRRSRPFSAPARRFTLQLPGQFAGAELCVLSIATE